jgi:hypothetical protein
MEIRKERGFPQRLEKDLAKNARLFHSSHRPDGGDPHLKKDDFLSEEWGAPPGAFGGQEVNSMDLAYDREMVHATKG